MQGFEAVEWVMGLGTVALVAIGAFYFLPTIIALARGANGCAVFFLNLILGWTLIGWVVAFAMACMSQPRSSAPNRPHSSPYGWQEGPGR